MNTPTKPNKADLAAARDSSESAGGVVLECEELTDLNVVEMLAQLLGTGQDPADHAGAEMEVSCGPDDPDIVVVALGRDYRIDGDGIWLRPLGSPAPEHGPGPFFGERGNHARKLTAAGTVQLHQNPTQIVLVEDGYEDLDTPAPTLTIRTATGVAANVVWRWDWFTMSLPDNDRLALTTCTPEMNAWPNNPFTNPNPTN